MMNKYYLIGMSLQERKNLMNYPISYLYMINMNIKYTELLNRLVIFALFVKENLYSSRMIFTSKIVLKNRGKLLK
jgi:hypothetical protein